MQLYALNEKKSLLCASQAINQQNYFCTECGGIVRLRGGIHRRKHFYHLSPALHCRQNGKSLTHLAVQYHFLSLIPDSDCFLEKRFPSINRIADVVWESKKLIFEIQCSPITADEVQNRNRDYLSQGYQVVWILHEKTFNRTLYSAAEKYLRQHPHFYTNIKEDGEGNIYDQFDVFESGRRRFKSPPIPFDLFSPKKLCKTPPLSLPAFLSNRLKNWPLHFTGDLIDLGLSSDNPILDYIYQIESSLDKEYRLDLKTTVKCWLKALFKPYFILFHFLLEKACK
jgi:competence protein CoiA